MKKVLTTYILMVLFTSFAQAADLWEHIPTPNDNEFADITIAPSGDLYACGTGIYRSTDKGLSWLGINKYEFMGSIIQFDELDVNFQAIAVTKSGTIIASLANGLVFSSTNLGQEWKVLPEIYYNVKKIVIDNNDRIYFADYRRLIYSDNQGAKWQEYPLAIAKDSFIFDILCDGSGNVYVAAIGELFVKLNDENDFKTISLGSEIGSIRILASNKNNVFALSDNGFILSDDSAKTWLYLSKSSLADNVNSLNIDEEGNLYVCTKDDGVYVSDDKGESWNSISDIFTGNKVNRILPGEDDMYIATNGLYSKNTGNSGWQKISEGAGNSNLEFLGISESGKCLIRTNYALYYSDNGMQSWKMFERSSVLTGILNNTLPKSCLIDQEDNVFIIDDSVLFVSTNMGMSWDSIAEFNAIVKIWSDAEGNLYLHDYIGGIYISEDYGKTWFHSINPLFVQYFGLGVSGELLCVGLDSLYISKNRGYKWESTGYPGLVKTQLVRKAEINGDNIYLAKDNDGFVFSTDKGKTWSSNNMGLVPEGNLELKMKDIIVDGTGILSFSNCGVYKLNFLDGKWAKYESGIKRGINGKFKRINDGRIYLWSSAGLFRTTEAANGANDDEDIAFQLPIYPNPAAESIVFPSLITNGGFSVYNSQGVCVKTGEITDRIYIGDLPAGNYVIKTNENLFSFIKF